MYRGSEACVEGEVWGETRSFVHAAVETMLIESPHDRSNIYSRAKTLLEMPLPQNTGARARRAGDTASARDDQ